MGNKSSKEDILKSRADLHEAENKDLKKKIEEMKQNREPLDVPWRDVGENFFSLQKKQELMAFIDDLELPDGCENINLLMTGNIGSGKSSFANTLKTVFNNTGEIASPAATYGITSSSVTRKLHEITLKTYENGKKIRIYDCRGIDPYDPSCPETAFEEDLRKIIEGHVMKDYEFKKDKPINPDFKKFRVDPTISDKMHCVLIVMKAANENKDTSILNSIKVFSEQNNVPIRLILTSMDELELYELKSVRSIFRSRDAKNKVEKAKLKFELQDHQILPVANYVKGTTLDFNRDVLVLQAAKNILQEALSFIADNM